jgi:hypothetical protein
MKFCNMCNGIAAECGLESSPEPVRGRQDCDRPLYELVRRRQGIPLSAFTEVRDAHRDHVLQSMLSSSPRGSETSSDTGSSGRSVRSGDGDKFTLDDLERIKNRNNKPRLAAPRLPWK